MPKTYHNTLCFLVGLGGKSETEIKEEFPEVPVTVIKEVLKTLKTDKAKAGGKRREKEVAPPPPSPPPRTPSKKNPVDDEGCHFLFFLF